MDKLGKKFLNKYKPIAVMEKRDSYTAYKVEEISSGRCYIVKYYHINMFWQAIGSVKQQLERLAADQSEFSPNIYDIGEEENELYVVFEIVSGKLLGEILVHPKKMSNVWCLKLVKKIVEGLQYFFKNNITLYSVNPNNIFVMNTEDNEVSIKFGELVSGAFEGMDNEIMMNQVIYMAPEQVGSARKKNDIRSDFYSVGVLMYQLLTGRLPFRAKNINQYMYQQLAQLPGPISRDNPEVSNSLNDMVLCLLEKDPNNRYQSTESLLYDIREYLSGNINFQYNSYDEISKIQFRVKDFLPNKKLVALESILDKGTGLIVVSGEKNTGKSIVMDLVKLKFQNSKNIMVYRDCKFKSFDTETLRNLLLEYLKIFETYPVRRQKMIRQELKNQAISKDIICNGNKRLEHFFVKGYNEKKAQGNEEDQFIKLWKVIADVEEHLVFILENLNYDLKGNKLFQNFYSSIQKVLLCFSFLEYPAVNDDTVFHIYLTKLSEEDILRTLNQITNHKIENPKKMAQYIYKKSRGNIYLASEVTNLLFQKEALIYREGLWRENPIVLFDLGLPADLVQEIIESSGQLSLNAMNLVMVLSSINGVLAWTYVKKVLELEGGDTESAVKELSKLQFIEPKIKDSLYYTFTDNDIYQYFRSKLSKKQIADYSQKVAEVLESEYLRFHNKKNAVTMTCYYMRANNSEKIKEYAFDTALILKNQGKNKQAIDMLNAYLNSLDYEDKNINLFYNAQKMIGEIYIAEGYLLQAEKTFDQLLQLDLTKKMRKDILEERSWVSFYKGNFQETFEYIKLLLNEENKKLPKTKFGLYAGIAVQGIIRWVQRNLNNHNHKIENETFNKNLRKGLSQSVLWAVLMVDTRYFIYMILRRANRQWKRKENLEEIVFSYFGLSQVLMLSSLNKIAKIYKNKALDLTEKIGDDHITMFAYAISAYLSEMQGDYEKQLNYTLMALQIHKKLQYSPYYSMTISALIRAYNYLGDYENMLRYNKFYQSRAKETGDIYGEITSNLYQLQYYRGYGKFENAIKCGKNGLELAKNIGDFYSQFCCAIEIGVTYHFMGKEDQAIRHFDMALEVKKDKHFPTEYIGLLYSYYVMALCFKQKKIRQVHPKDESLFMTISKMAHKAVSQTKLPTYYGSALKCMAEWQALRGDNEAAKKYYIESINYSIKYKRQWLMGITQMSYGNFLTEIGEKENAIQQYVLAEYHFRELKAEAFAIIAKRQLESLHSGFKGIGNDLSQFQVRLQAERKNLVLTDLIRDLSSVLDYKELLQKIIMVLLQASGAQQVVIFKLSENQKLEIEEFYANDNLKITNKKKMLEQVPINLIKSVQQTKEILVLNNAEKTEYAKFDDLIKEKRIKSVLILPICYKNSIKAICYLENSLSTGMFTEDIVENMKIVSSQMAISIENAVLYKNATTDDLTGLYTRKHFDYLFQEELDYAKNNNSDLGVVFIDIDKFKNINDTYGHINGDKVLVELSQFLKRNCRITDTIGRFGGEEIILLLKGTSATDSFQFAERLRKKLECHNINIGNRIINITASFGVSSYPVHGETRVELINKADTALYISKNEGRNRVTLAK